MSAPAHYTQYGMQPIEVCKYLDFCLGNVVKYAMRAPYKNGVEDIDKAWDYYNWAYEMRKKGDKFISDKARKKIEEFMEILKKEKITEILHYQIMLLKDISYFDEFPKVMQIRLTKLRELLAN